MGVASASTGHTPFIAAIHCVSEENFAILASSRKVMENMCDLVRGEEVRGKGVEECSRCQKPP